MHSFHRDISDQSEKMSAEILVVPKNGQGHLFPCMELCNHLISRNYATTLILDSDITSSIPPHLTRSPPFNIVDVSSSSAPSDFRHGLPNPQLLGGIEALLSKKSDDPNSTRPVCAIIDHIMNKTQQVFLKFDIPTVIFITSGACWAAVQHAAWVVKPADMKPGDTRKLPGLPEEMVLSYSDIQQRRHWIAPQFRTGQGSKKAPGPPFPGEPARWVDEVKISSAILLNTCDDLERPFLDYIANLTGKPVYGVGPLLPEQFWLSNESLLQDRSIRPQRESNFTDEEVIQWLDQKPRRSVVLISFGSEVGPSVEEYPELAAGLEESNRPFIWVIQRRPTGSESYFPHGLDTKVGERGLIIHGWAPQLLILSHQSTAGFVSHCGWNSTIEAIVRGVPLVAWPIRGDQYYNAMLVVRHLKVGIMVCDGYPADRVKKDDVVQCVERIVTDEEMRGSVATIRAKFERGFPTSSIAALDEFLFGNGK